METIENGGVLSAAGFRAGAARAGIKSVAGEADVALIVADGPASAAGVFTTNKFAAAAVQWNRGVLPRPDARAVVVNSGNANACTGERGLADARACAKLAAELVGCRPEQVCLASTGIIGHALPMPKLTAGIRQAHAALREDEAAGRAAARAIMTTDTRPKTAAVRAEAAGAAFHVGGMAKGAGMIAPHMATLLAFVTTDAHVPPELLHNLLRGATDLTLNRVTVDGDASTNDTVLALAGGASGAKVGQDGPTRKAFAEALGAVLGSLARQIAADGEGASRMIEVCVSGANDDEEAEAAARAVAESPLVKCAVYGGDPNWGRIVCALGYSRADVRPAETSVRIGEVLVFRNGEPTGRDAKHQMTGPEVQLAIQLGSGPGRATVWTCDLTEEYVRINAEYPT
jgi:glutamate N-acetyltransferase/amino-acid N-acetyltransferase